MTSPTSELDPEQVQAKMDDFNRTNYKALKVSRQRHATRMLVIGQLPSRNVCARMALLCA